jgi:hypothetical protein
MKKITWLLMTVFVWWHNATAQPKGGLEQYYFMKNKTIAINPKAWYQSDAGWYIEGRYNYEAAQTMSVVAGKTIEYDDADFSFSVTPMAGFVAGQFNGGIIGGNASADYKKYQFALQTQYAFSGANRSCNFMYTWADLSYAVSGNFSAGLSLQRTSMYRIKGQSETGFFLKGSFGSWELPVYIFNPGSNERYAVLGLSISLE